ncbi:MAG: hypothetical protein MJ208_02925 [Bacilli bacterium]|nr:hypothetical protein [Bacilli bacterium]
MNVKEKVTYMNLLLETYGSLLTTTQQKIMVDKYQYDLSLQEISEQYSITRSAALDAIKVASKKLENYEKKLNLIKKKEKILKIVKDKKLRKEIKTIL